MEHPAQPVAAASPEFVIPTVVAERAYARPRSRTGLGCLALTLFGLLALAVLYIVVLTGSSSDIANDHGVKEKYHSLSKSGKNKIAVLEVEGAIMDGESVKRIIDVIRRDEKVKALVLRVVSPGGTVSGSDFIYHHLQELLKDREIPMVVSMGGIAASGGYYISMAVGHTPDTIFAEPTTWTGSVGVIIPHYNFSGFLSEHKIEEDSIKSAPLKAIGSFTKPMTEQERRILQGLVDESFGDFKKIVQSGRERYVKNPAELDAVATGQVFTSRQAKENGLVDRIGYIEEAIERAMELANLNKSDTKAVKYYRHTGFFDIFGGSERVQPGFDLAKMLDLTVPRAYYMCTWLPAFESLAKP